MNFINALTHIIKTHHYHLLHTFNFKTVFICQSVFVTIKKLNFYKYVISANANQLNKQEKKLFLTSQRLINLLICSDKQSPHRLNGLESNSNRVKHSLLNSEDENRTETLIRDKTELSSSANANYQCLSYQVQKEVVMLFTHLTVSSSVLEQVCKVSVLQRYLQSEQNAPALSVQADRV